MHSVDHIAQMLLELIGAVITPVKSSKWRQHVKELSMSVVFTKFFSTWVKCWLLRSQCKFCGGENALEGGLRKTFNGLEATVQIEWALNMFWARRCS